MVRILILSSLVIGGCGGSKFDAPWDEANALPDAVDGTFEALIGDRVPGSASGTIAGEALLLPPAHSGLPARACSSGGKGQCMQPLPQHLPWASRPSSVNTNSPVRGST